MHNIDFNKSCPHNKQYWVKHGASACGWSTLKYSTMTKPCPHPQRNNICYHWYLLDGISTGKYNFVKCRQHCKGLGGMTVIEICRLQCLLGLLIWKQCVLNTSRHIRRDVDEEGFIIRLCQLQLPLSDLETICDCGASGDPVWDAPEMANTWWVYRVRFHNGSWYMKASLERKKLRTFKANVLKSKYI